MNPDQKPAADLKKTNWRRAFDSLPTNIGRASANVGSARLDELCYNGHLNFEVTFWNLNRRR